MCDATDYARFHDIPDDPFLHLDTFLGVTRASALQAVHLERLLLHGYAKRIYLASGSTKTAEFSDVSRWIQELREASTPTIGGQPVELHTADLRDPLTNANLGTRIRFTFNTTDGSTHQKEIVLIADGMPVNFFSTAFPAK